MYWQMDDTEVNKYIKILPAEDIRILFGIENKQKRKGLRELASAGIVKMGK